MKTNFRRGKAGFTMIELMAVIVIIVILAALVVGGLGFVQERQAKEKAKVQLSLLGKALEEYKLDMGYYPRPVTLNGEGMNSSSALYIKLFYEGYEYNKNAARADTPSDPKASKIYLADLDPTSTKQGWVTNVTTPEPPATTKVMDPWGNEYRYRPGKTNSGEINTSAVNPDYDLWSVGKDGKTKAGTSAGDLKAAENRDDLRNF